MSDGDASIISLYGDASFVGLICSTSCFLIGASYFFMLVIILRLILPKKYISMRRCFTQLYRPDGFFDYYK